MAHIHLPGDAGSNGVFLKRGGICTRSVLKSGREALDIQKPQIIPQFSGPFP